MNQCQKCKEYWFSSSSAYHKCPPRWEACDPEYDNTYWFSVYAYDEESAVLKAAEILDLRCGEGPFKHEFLIREYGSSNSPKKWETSFEYTVEYSACQKE